MKLKQLEYFRVICKYSNITRAAEELHVSQPSLSSVIRDLEEEFQVPLFHRLSKGLVPTEQGKVLLEEAKLLLGQAEHLTARMQALVSENPVIRLGTPPMMATLIFPRLLRAFSARHPDIRVEMMEHGSLANRSLLLEGRLDAALISAAATPPRHLRLPGAGSGGYLLLRIPAPRPGCPALPLSRRCPGYSPGPAGGGFLPGQLCDPVLWGTRHVAPYPAAHQPACHHPAAD